MNDVLIAIGFTLPFLTIGVIGLAAWLRQQRVKRQ